MYRGIIITAPFTYKTFENWTLCLGYKTNENIHNPPASVLPHDNRHFQSVCPRRAVW